MNKINSKILGTGSYLPKNIVTNYDLEKRLDTTHDWIVQRTGIHQRHIADSKETVAFMAAEAARQALVAANISKNQIETMGGKIEVESELGVGTTFKIYIK
jgi:3-oxoacyl-[acyl-carrier-protein] synthase-3